MNKYLKEFTTYINRKYEKIEPEKVEIFKDYFSDPLWVKALLDDGAEETDAYAFLKKIGAEIKNLEVFEREKQEILFNELLFERNARNIKLYSQLHRNSEYRFSCYLENEKILRYVTREKGIEQLVKCVLNDVLEYIHEEPKFLLLLLYTPALEGSLRQLLLSRIQDESIDYADVFSMPKLWEKYIEIEIGTDSKCKDLIEKHKLKRTWNNILFSFRQINTDDEKTLVDYINNLSLNEEDILNDHSAIHKRLNDVVKKFLLFIFENIDVNDRVLTSFVSVVKENDLFFVPDIFFEKYVDEENSLEDKYKKWNAGKCAQILKFFFSMSFKSCYKYAKLIYYLVKSNLQEVFDCLDKLGNEYRDSRKITYSFYSLNRNRKYFFVSIYASLLCFDNNEEQDSFNYDDVEYLLDRMDLDILDDVIDAWKDKFSEKQLKKCVKNILIHEKWMYNKLREQRNTRQMESVHFLNGLINLVEKQWMSQTIKYMEMHGLLHKENISGSEVFLSRYNMYRDAIYKYAFG